MPRLVDSEPRYYDQDFQRFKSRFKIYSLGSDIKSVGRRDLGDQVLNIFEHYSDRFVDPQVYVPLDFHAVFQIDHSPVDRTYAAWQTKGIPGKGAESNLYLMDTLLTDNGQPLEVGHGELRYDFSNQDAFFKLKPFVGYTQTENEFKRKGYGLRRLVIMNALSQTLFGLPLHSDHFHKILEAKEAEEVWNKLVSLNLAEVVEDNQEVRRYAFVQNDLQPFLDLINNHQSPQK